MIGQLVTIAFYVALIFAAAAFVAWLLEVFNPYEQFEAEAHANDSDDDRDQALDWRTEEPWQPYVGGIPSELARLNEPAAEVPADGWSDVLRRDPDECVDCAKLGPLEYPPEGGWPEREPDISPRDEAEAQAVAERVIENLQRQRDEWEADEFRRALGPNGGAS